jgi:hypothetical protein
MNPVVGDGDYTKTERTRRLREWRISQGWKRHDMWLAPDKIDYNTVRERLKKLCTDAEWSEKPQDYKYEIVMMELRTIICDMHGPTNGTMPD